MILKGDFEYSADAFRRRFPNWNMIGSFTDRRCAALLEMLFNLGETRFDGFERMVLAANLGLWEEASAHCLDSKAARQLPDRYERIAKMIREG